MIQEPLADKIKTGLRWSSISQFSNQLITFVLSIVLARLIGPDDYGVLAMATIITGFITLCIDFGINNIVVQKQNLTQQFLSTAFWLNISIAIFFALLLIYSSSFLAVFYNTPILNQVLTVLAFPSILHACTVVPMALLHKRFQFKRIFFVQFLSLIISGLVVLVLVFKEYSLWGLVFQIVITKLVMVVILFFVTNWHPSLIISRDSLKEIGKYSLPILGYRAMNYTTKNIDSLLIGKTLGEKALGEYNRAYSLMYLPVTNVTKVFSSVMFPSYSVQQNNLKWIKDNFLKVSRIIAFITFPLLFTLTVLSEPFILFLLGEEWKGVVPILEVLSIVGAFNSLSLMNNQIYFVLNNNNKLFRLELFIQPVKIIFIIFGLRWGVMGVTYGYAISTLLLEPVAYYFMGKQINLSVLEVYKNILSVFIGSVLSVVSIYFIRVFFFTEVNNFVQLVALTILSGLLYLLFLSQSIVLSEFIDFLKGRSTKQKAKR